MTIVADLITRLKTDNKDFISGMRNAEMSASQFASKASKSFLLLGAVITGVLVTGFLKLNDVINETAGNIDDFNDKAKSLNIDYNQFQRLSYAAKLNGSSTDELTAALTRLTKKSSEAQNGNKSAVDSFKALGISVDDLRNKDPGQIFQMVGEKIKQLPSYAQQADAAFSLFGKKGISQLQLLTANFAGVNQEFDSLGLGISQNQADMVASFNDSKDSLAAIWEDFKEQITVLAVPALQQLVEWIKTTIKEAGGLKPIAMSVADAFVGGLQGVVGVFEGIVLAIQNVQLELLKTKQLFNNVGSLGGYGDALRGKLGFLDDDEVVKRFTDKQKLTDEISALQNKIDTPSSMQKNLEDVRTNIKTSQAQNNASNSLGKIKVELHADNDSIINAVIKHNSLNETVKAAVVAVAANEARGVRN